jgi:hypothetical protein
MFNRARAREGAYGFQGWKTNNDLFHTDTFSEFHFQR